MHDDLGASRLLVAFADGVGAVAVRLPMHALAPFAVGLREDLDVVRDHVCGIKAEAEVTDDALSARFFVFFEEVRSTREGDLRDVFFHFLFGHTDAVVFDGQRSRLVVRRDDDPIAFVFRSFAERDELFILRDGIRCVGDDLPQKDVLIRIQPLFDDGHHIFACDPDIALSFHNP